MVNRAYILLLCFILLPFQAAAEFKASIDRNPVLAGEFFNLTLQADKNVKGQQPDTSVLLKHFVVGPTSVRSNTNITNGQVNHSTQWQIELMARNPGNYTIPAFTVANMQSSPVTVNVVASNKKDKQNKEVYIETSMQSDALYVQQAGVYTIKLFLANELTEGQLGSPEMQTANVSQLGKQKENYEIIDGVRYLVIERNYLIQPQKSGLHIIKSPYFKGRIRDNYRSRAASAIGKDVQLTIKPIPENVTGNWLPSELVTLNEEWQPKKSEYQVGEPITRTITMTALGITKEQLPEINLPSIKGVRSYSDQADANNLVRNGKVISQKVESFALMPQAPGDYTLPEVRVPWFNIITNRIEYAKLPERNITIIGDPNFVTPSQTPQLQTEDTNQVEIQQQKAPSNSQIPSYYYLITLVGYLLWLITLVLLWRKKSPHSTIDKGDKRVETRPSDSPILALRKAVKDNNQRAFYHGLVKLCQQHSQSSDLTKLCQRINNQTVSEQIQQLQRNLYAGQNQPIDLNLIFNEAKQLTLKANKNSELNSLY